MFHYTDDHGFKAISSQQSWTFKAFEPQGPHADGAYFSILPPWTPKLARKLRLPKGKLQWLFKFDGQEGLIPLDEGKGRGEYIFYCPEDYTVEPHRQRFKDKVEKYQEAIQ